MDRFEKVALQGLDAISEYLTYSGENKTYLNRAKAGAAAVGAYTRLRATMANERQIALLEQRRLEGIGGTNVPALPEAPAPGSNWNGKVLSAVMPNSGLAQS